MLDPISWLIIQVLEAYKWVIIVAVVVSWLVAFNVINLHNGIVRAIVRFLDALTEPVFRQVRRVIPPFGGIDISPLIVLFAVMFIEYVIEWAALRLAY